MSFDINYLIWDEIADLINISIKNYIDESVWLPVFESIGGSINSYIMIDYEY